MIIYNKMLDIGKKLDILCKKEYSFKLSKNSFNKNRVIFMLINTTKNNIIYDNLKYIKKKLNIKQLPKIKKNGFITEFIYGFDFDNKLYKIYVTFKEFDELETIHGLEFKNNKIIPRVYIEKKTKYDLSKKYNFLKRFNKYINYKNFNKYYTRVVNKEVDSIHLIYNIKPELYTVKNLFIKICNYLNWEKQKLLNFFTELKDKKYYINIIGFSKNNINLYIFKY
tara:strand:- start:13 stop:684 length:672 start_codon:yes stop_codon:yes gene_type:complete